jgi:ATP-binding protein involved in chromosome partitioning
MAVRRALAGVIDPELGADIVDLGMVSDVTVGATGTVSVEVALTIAGCPLRSQLRGDIDAAVRALPGVSAVDVHFGVMDTSGRRDLMDRARRRAQERAVGTDLPAHTRVLAITSGKGGVGKSSVATNLAVALAADGPTVGLLDADIWGFSVPRLLGLAGDLQAEAGKIVPVEQPAGRGMLRVVSMGFLAEEESAIMWRGLKLNRAVQQFLEDVRWGELDYLVVDMPPGTGDVHMGLARMLARTEVVVVTTPPVAAQQVAARAADMARKGHLRIVGVVENMSGFVCEHGTHYPIFGQGGGDRLARSIGVPLIGAVPFDPAMAAGGDAGTPVVLSPGPAGDELRRIARHLAAETPERTVADGCTARLLGAVERAVEAGTAGAGRTSGAAETGGATRTGGASKTAGTSGAAETGGATRTGGASKTAGASSASGTGTV